jgi:tRNA nucleotidyltransferase/poly(A) polymerase
MSEILNTPPEFQKTMTDIVSKAEPLGLSVYAVGGFVRDNLLGNKPKDLDVVAVIENEELYQKSLQ